MSLYYRKILIVFIFVFLSLQQAAATIPIRVGSLAQVSQEAALGYYTEVNDYEDVISGVYWLGKSPIAARVMSAYVKFAVKYADVTEEGVPDCLNCFDPREGYGNNEAFFALDAYFGMEANFNPLLARAGIGWDLGEMFIDSIFTSDDETESNLDLFFELALGLDLNAINVLVHAKYNKMNGVYLDKHNEWFYGVNLEFKF